MVVIVLAAAAGAAAPAAAMVVPGPAAAAGEWYAAPRVNAWGAGLVDAGTGVRLWSRDVNVARPMGSITKVMTALIVLSAGDLSRKIKVTAGAIRYVHKRGASSAGLIAGDVLTARQLLEAMLLPSGCDAAYLLASSYGPGRGGRVRGEDERHGEGDGAGVDPFFVVRRNALPDRAFHLLHPG